MKSSYIYIIIIALLAASCSGNKQSFTLSGKFKGLQDGAFMCFSRSPEWGSLDTVKIVDGEFTMTHSLTDTSIIILQYPNFLQTQVIAIPGGKAKLRGDANNIKRVKVSGDDENEELSDFNDRTAGLGERQARLEAEAFIRDNPQLWASVALFERFFLQAERPDYNKIDKLLELMLKACPNRHYLHLIANEVMPLLKCRAGVRLPTFKASTIDGAVVDNSTFKGKAVLVTFWSTIDNDFVFPVVNQRHLMRRVANRVAQLNICLDVDTASCLRVLRADTIGGYNVCDRKAFDSPLVKLFGLKKMPANILVDSKGVVRVRDVAPENLEEEFRKLGIN